MLRAQAACNAHMTLTAGQRTRWSAQSGCSMAQLVSLRRVAVSKKKTLLRLLRFASWTAAVMDTPLVLPPHRPVSSDKRFELGAEREAALASGLLVLPGFLPSVIVAHSKHSSQASRHCRLRDVRISLEKSGAGERNADNILCSEAVISPWRAACKEWGVAHSGTCALPSLSYLRRTHV